MGISLSTIWSRSFAPAATIVAAAVLTATALAQSPATRPSIPGTLTGVIAFVDVNVVTMDTEKVLAKHTVLVEGGRITALGPASRVRVPIGAVRIDGQDKYLIPGLADMHVHLDEVTYQDSVALERFLGHFLAYGVTTVRNMTHQGPARSLQFKARVAAGELLGPRIYTSGIWGPKHYVDGDGRATGKGPEPRLDSVAAYVAVYKAAGYDHVKPYTEGRPVFDSLLAAARRLGLPVAGHVPHPFSSEANAQRDTTLSLEMVLASGAYRSIEHLMGYWDYQPPPGFPRLDEPKLPARAAATARAGVWNTPTLALAELYRLDPQAWDGEKGRRAESEEQRKVVQALHRAGAGLLLGSDLNENWGRGWSTPGVVHHELAALVRAGLTPYEALLTGTRNPAAYFGALDSTGTIAVGKRADMVLLAGNPLRDLRLTREPVGVMLRGRWLDRATLDEVLSRPLHDKTSFGALELLHREGYLGFHPYLADSLKRTFVPQLQALADSLKVANAGGKSTSGYVLQRVAKWLGSVQLALTPEQRESFEPVVRVWLREQARQGVQLDERNP